MRNNLGAVLDVQLVEDVAQVILDGVLRYDKAGRQLPVRRDALYEQVEDLALPLSQLIGRLDLPTRRRAGELR